MSASIFIVEDEALIRMMLVEMIEDLGHKVIGEAGRIDEGRSLADTLEYDLAILDINLQGFNVQPIAEAVRRRGRPLFFLSGYGSDGAPIGFEGTPILNKPCTPDRLKRMIDAVVSNQGFSEVLQGVPPISRRYGALRCSAWGPALDIISALGCCCPSESDTGGFQKWRSVTVS